MDDRTDRIRMRAYQIWRDAGEPIDLADEHWTRAEREIGPASSEPPDGVEEAPGGTDKAGSPIGAINDFGA